MPKKGFTLVELLIVISIIAVLSVVGLTAYSGVQQKARDTKRRADIDAIAKVMESKYDIKTAVYSTALSSLNTNFTSSQLPVPPKRDDYIVSSDGKGFITCSKLDAASADLTAQQCIATYNIGVNKQNCYCQKSLSGSTQSIIAAASIGGTFGFTAPDNLAVLDTFTRSNSTTGLGGTWEYSGTNDSWGILGNQARHMNNRSVNIYAVMDGRYSDGIVRITFSYLVQDQGMVFRYADSNNTYRLTADGHGYWLQKIVSGVTTNVGEVAIPNFNSTYRGTSADITVVMQGDNIQVFIDSSKGNSWTISYADTSLRNNTKAGLWVYADTTMSWDNFSVSAFHPVPTPTPTPTPTPVPVCAYFNNQSIGTSQSCRYTSGGLPVTIVVKCTELETNLNCSGASGNYASSRGVKWYNLDGTFGGSGLWLLTGSSSTGWPQVTVQVIP